MDKLEEIIREEARQVPVGLLDLLRSMPTSVEDIPAGDLALWSRGFLRSLFIENDASLFEPGFGPDDERRRAKLFRLLSMLITNAPTSSQTTSKQQRLSNELAWEAWRFRPTASEGKHPKSASFAWYCLQSECVSAAALLVAGGLSRSTACKEVAKLIKRHEKHSGLETSWETIRGDWFEKFGDSTLLRDTEETHSFPLATLRAWLEELRYGKWLEIEIETRPDFVEFAVCQRRDLIDRYIPERIKAACANWIRETP